ncbi:hypothetical protein DFAR_2180005 [Desulfarculales bacterium]
MMANRSGPKAQNVLADQIILLTGSLTDCPCPLRRLKDRWEIKLF